MNRNVVWLLLCCLPGVLLVLAVAWSTTPDVPSAAQRLPTVPLRLMGAEGFRAAPADAYAQVSYGGDPAALPESAAVFVFLREPGQRMPIAVGRFEPAELPLRVAFGPLGDGAAELVARLSLTGGVEGDARDVEVRVPVRRRGDEVALSLPASSPAPPSQ